MSKEFKREERYIVIKRKDLNEIPDHLRHEIVNAIKEANLPPRECVVIESDWPEYEPAWAAIERRVTGAPAWAGIGPPPAGTVCEFRELSNGSSEWHVVRVCYLSKSTALLAFVEVQEDDNEACFSPENVEFRLCRTPEQIAAEERVKTIEDMVSTSPMLDKGWARKVCTALYDAGYRKQVAP